MSVKITYFVHGTTTDNEKGLSSGWSDVEISELGIKQSLDLKKEVKNRKFDAVFCSDLKRAVDTTNTAFAGLAPVITDQRLRECNYGELNGQASVIVEPLCENIEKRFPGGESYKDVQARISDFLNFLRSNYEDKSVAIVAHKAPQLVLDHLLSEKSWEEAFLEDWRKTKSWQPGWEYILN